ncbi:MAG: hypothetical protein WDW38_006498 [Sanguina aurantia]
MAIGTAPQCHVASILFSGLRPLHGHRPTRFGRLLARVADTHAGASDRMRNCAASDGLSCMVKISTRNRGGAR